MSKSKDKNKDKNKSRKKRFFDLLVGKNVVIQARGGTIYEGVFRGIDGYYILLTDAKITGAKKIAYVDIVGIQNSVIAHIHVEPKAIEDKPN